MTRVHFRALAAIAVIAVLFAGLAVWHTLAKTGPREEGQLLLPGLEAHLADIAAIEIVIGAGTGDQDIVIKRALLDKGQAWVLPAKDDYPASPARVEPFLDRLAAMRLIEKKTDDPGRYGALGLDKASSDPVSKSVVKEVKLFNAAGESLGDVDFGRPNFTMGRMGGGIYVRRDGEPQTWLAEGVIDIPETPLAFADTTIFLDINPQSIVSATVIEKSATIFKISRGKDNLLTLMPASRTLDQAKLMQFVTLPAALDFDDLRRADKMRGKPIRNVAFRQADGAQYNLTILPDAGEDKTLWVSASKSNSPDAAAFNAAHQDYLYRLPEGHQTILMGKPSDFALLQKIPMPKDKKP